MAGIKKVLDFFVKVEPDAGAPALSDEELRKILAEDEPPAQPAPAPARAAPATPAAGPPPSRAARPVSFGSGGAAAPPPAPLPRPRVADVAAPAVAQVRPPAAGTPTPEELPDFATIYRAAKVPAPGHGYTVDKVAVMLANPRLAGMADTIKANSVLMALEVAGVPINDVVADAAARDKALDDFEAWWGQKLAKLEADKRAENTAIEEEINRYLEQQRERIRANNEALQKAQGTFGAWCDTKRAEELKLYDTIQPFVTQNPITLNTGAVQPPTPPAPGPGPAGGRSGT